MLCFFGKEIFRQKVDCGCIEQETGRTICLEVSKCYGIHKCELEILGGRDEEMPLQSIERPNHDQSKCTGGIV